jgi:thioredoxin reductase
MADPQNFEVIIIGGSYAGLSAAMTLGRARRHVVVIDAGNPCNIHAPFSHNFLTHDGEKPSDIARVAKQQVLQYPTITFVEAIAVKSQKIDGFFCIETNTQKSFNGQKLLFSTGLTDIIPDVPGYAECWGISILHCPYCHGYEAKDQKTGILGNGELAFEMAKMIAQWTNDLAIFTDGKAVFSESESQKLKQHQIQIVETEIKAFEHENGQIRNIVFNGGSKHKISALYAHPHTKQQCDFSTVFGCKMNGHGCIDTDVFQKTNIPGIYAAGDCASVGRAISVAVAAGTVAGMFINKELVEESFGVQ